MAEQLEDFVIDELSSTIEKYEELKEKFEELQEEKRKYEIENNDLKHDMEILEDRINYLQLQSIRDEVEKSRMTLKDRINQENIERLNNFMLQAIEIYSNYIGNLENQIEKYETMKTDVCVKPNNPGKIPTYTIIRKYKYPYFIIRSTNYHEALEESKKVYPNLKEVYKVNYDHEETYSNNRLVTEFNHIDIFDKEMLLVNYTEQKLADDLKNFSMTHQNGYHTFCLIKKEEYPYYAYRVQKENYIQTKMKRENTFPNALEICTLFDIPNAITFHNRIREKFPKHVSGNHIKLPDNYTEEEFIREVKRMAEPPSLSP